MKKANLLLAVSVLSIGLLLAGCSNSKGTASSSSSSSSSKASSSQTSSTNSSSSSSISESSSSSASSSSQQQTSMNLAEIVQGNFESIQGTWNSQTDSLQFSGNTAAAVHDGKSYPQTIDTLKNSSNAAGTVMGNIYEPGTIGGAVIYFIPAGVSIPGTDSSKERILMAQYDITDSRNANNNTQNVMYKTN